MILVPLAVERDGRRVRISAEHVDVTVDTPGCAHLQEGKGSGRDSILDPALIADGPACGYGREVAPAVLGRELRRVEGVGAEVRLDAVTVVIGITQTGEVGKARRFRRGVAEFLGRIILHVVQITEVGIVSLQNVRTGGRAADVIRFVFDEGHTGHHVEAVLLGKDLAVVGEILPLIVEPGVGGSREGVRLDVGLAVGPIRSLIAVRIALGDAETETAGDDQTLDRFEIREQDAVDIETFAGAVGGVPLYERAAASGLQPFSSPRKRYGYSEVPS